MTSNQQFKSSFSPDGSNNNRRIRFADDERTSGRWDNETGSWEELSESYRKPIRDGIRMAKKLAPTDMLMMPVVKGDA
mgnify:CR=1 FL=1